jgi:polyene macrolide polyketide synthase
MQAARADGAMAAIAAPEHDVLATLDGLADRVAVAAVNTPAATVISGDRDTVRAVAARWRDAGHRVRALNVSHAFHSPHMDQALPAFLDAARTVTYHPPAVPLVSNLTGQLAGDEIRTPDYWAAHIRATVRYADGVTALAAAGATAYLEIGPDATLTTATLDTLTTPPRLAVPALRKDAPEPDTLLTALAHLHANGTDINWTALYPPAPQPHHQLPTYPFQQRRHWHDIASTSAHGAAMLGLGAANHPLLAATVGLADADEVVFTGRLASRAPSWLSDHVIGDVTLVPGTAFVEMAMRVGEESGCPRVQELVIAAPLRLSGGPAVQIQVRAGAPDGSGMRPLTIHSRPADAAPDQPWLCHANGTLAPAAPAPGREPRAPSKDEAWPPPGAVAVDLGGAYEGLAGRGYGYGPAFRGLRAVWRAGEEILAEVALPEELEPEAGRYGVHPALLDAALHAILLTGTEREADQDILVPFSWNDVSLHATGASALRVRISPTGPDSVRLETADPTGMPALTIGSLELRPMPRAAGGHDDPDGTVFCVSWVDAGVEVAAGADADAGWAWVGSRWAVPGAVHADIGDLRAALSQGAAVPATVVLACPDGGGDDSDATAAAVLSAIQGWLADDRLADSRLAVVTSGAVAVLPGEDVTSLAQAPAWGLARSAQAEHPGRIVLVDADDQDDPAAALAAVLASGEPQAAVRGGQVLVPRLTRPAAAGHLAPPAGHPAWRLEVAGQAGTLENLALAPCPQFTAPLQPGQVRVALRAAGVNFRDIVTALGMVTDSRLPGGEGAGIVTEAGPGVTGLAPGDRVMGLFPDGVGPLAVTDARHVAPFPAGWTFAQAATVPITFATAYYGLADLARLQPGQSLLIHAASGGVGMAAVQIARHLGADVYATASPAKHATLRRLGIPGTRIASSRTLDFEDQFRAAAPRGIDTVLNSLAGEFTDATLRLQQPGGQFLDMGKTDIRDPALVAARHPGVTYQAFDLMDPGPDRLQEILAELSRLFHDGTLAPLPVTAWDIRRAPEAFRFMSQARHTGKIVLTIPAPPSPDGTTLITGGTGTLGAILARHLAAAGTRHLLLLSRRGPDAPGAGALRDDLASLGATATVTACDTADPAALAAAIDAIPPGHPLTTVIHAAGTTSDAPVTSQTPATLRATWAPKAATAWNLHRLTAARDLPGGFILFSSIAATLGTAGQANYAAANAYLDALATHRAARGLPATSLGWGLWEPATGITAALTQADHARLHRQGLAPLPPDHGLTLYDTAPRHPHPHLIPARLDLTSLYGLAREEALPPLLQGLIRTQAPRAAANAAPHSQTMAGQLAALQESERRQFMLDFVCSHVATVLDHHEQKGIEVTSAFKEIGFDSLTSVELRNRLAAGTGLRLPGAVVFDYPTPAALADYLQVLVLGPEKANGHSNGHPANDEESRIRAALAAIPLARLRNSGILDVLLSIASQEHDGEAEAGRTADDIDVMDAEDLVKAALKRD